jgi:hypothetical protein
MTSHRAVHHRRRLACDGGEIADITELRNRSGSVSVYDNDPVRTHQTSVSPAFSNNNAFIGWRFHGGCAFALRLIF